MRTKTIRISTKQKLPAMEIYVLQLLYPTVVLQEPKQKLFV